MACSVSAEAWKKLINAGVQLNNQEMTDVVFVGCGGVRVKPESVVNLDMTVYGCRVLVPTFVVRNQQDELIIGSNVIRHVIRQFKYDASYWKAVSSTSSGGQDRHQFLSLLAGLERWSDDEEPDRVGTVRCNRAVTLPAGSEFLVWGKLPRDVKVSPGSTVMTEPTSSHAAPRGIMVARVVTPLWGDRWVPLKIINVSDSPVTLRRNAKLADVCTCLALEDMGAQELSAAQQVMSTGTAGPSATMENVKPMRERLERVGLRDLDLESCDVAAEWRAKLADLVVKYEDIFSHHHLDCGEAKEFVHRIRLTDERPFRLPYRRVPPAEYQKLRRVISEMEEKEIIRKSTSEFASPLVLVWKKNGDLRYNGSNMHEDDRKYSAFTTPMGLYEYNRLPQGLCNSPASFMRMMTSIFGDQNFLSLLCYLDDLLVFAPTEALALERLELVFSRLRLHNLKLAPKKCWLLRRSVKFLGHIIDESGVSTDPAKVEAVNTMVTTDLMELDGVTPSQTRVRSFLGMVNYYQHFVPNYSTMAKPLFDLLAGQKQKHKGRPRGKRPALLRRLTPADWTPDHQKAFEELKTALLTSVVLAHPDFTRPFILSTDASLDGLGAVLSQVQDGDKVARPVAFASKSLSRAQKRYPAHRLEFLALKWSVCDKFSHWLKGHSFTVWTDNNPLTHIMTKPRLDACEQRWVAKLASYAFDIKYIPGPRNTVADALSRRPFVKPAAGRQLLQDPYSELLAKAVPVSADIVQDAFRQSATQDCLGCDDGMHYVSEGVKDRSFSKEEVSAILETHNLWESGARVRAVDVLQQLPQLVLTDGEPQLAFTERDLREGQLSDPVLSRVLHYVGRGRRPSRREKSREPAMVVRIHSDQGASFESHLIRELLKVAGVRKSRTTPYHPMGNGSVERFNRTLGNMIRALPPEAKHDWPRHLQTLTFMYNCTVHETTGFPPFYLMYGRVPRLPVDILFKNILRDPEISSYDRYVVSLTKDLQEAMAIAQEHANKEQNRQAELYNRRGKGKLIAVGDRVLVSNKRERGKRKTADRWESAVYTVVGINPSTHTYRISHPETGQERLVHRNLLMLVNFLPVDADSVSDGTFVSSDEEESSNIAVADVSLPVAGREVAGRRTREWIDNLTAVSADVHAECDSPEDVLSLGDESELTAASSECGFSHAPGEL
ncbi:hypothetical protein DPEC_G00086450 [Dallia pectoralis]|uniref:Uncharacterized protein n=2 Tax=Dallia pectoralis TaxID=75939 RepID=A0ACC2H048_DALPE|nr:hypothetical protein DPEC_G00086450 [Dallia pectoralis]